jgi:protoporphyrinogen/coproporphyrinogen III oxidase
LRTIVIGGGISGLACAWKLRELGASVLLFEQAEQPGGVIRTMRKGGCLLECGPQSFLGTDTLSALIRSLAIEDQLLHADPKAPRFVVVNGALRQVPLAPPALISSSLLSARTKFRVLADAFGKSTPPPDDESVAAFVRRKFGDELLDRLAGPFVSGIFAGDPEKLSLRSAFPSIHRWESESGSVIRGAIQSRPRGEKPRPGLCSFRDGVSTLPLRIAELLGSAVCTRVAVQSIMRHKANGKSGIEVHLQREGRAEVATADAVILAVPTDSAERILRAASPRCAELLGQIEYAPVAVVSTAYMRASVGVPLDGFGFLVPRTEKLRLLGTIWNSSLFPGRVPEGQVLLTSFMAGATDPELLGYIDQAIESAATTEMGRLLQITGAPVSGNIQRWTRAIPQYNLGHGRLLAAVQAELQQSPGIFLAGNHVDGPSIGNCIEQSFRVAGEAYQFLRRAS